MAGSFPTHVPQGRNLDIFWAVTLEKKSQGELAKQHNLSQQRVSQIVRSVRTFVALATSEQYNGVPQRAQLQLSCRVQLAKLEKRRWEMSRAWKESTRPKWSVKRVQSASGERVETVEKSQHGDWRVDRQLGEIDQQIVDTTRVLYEREWFGPEELRIADCGLRIREERAARMRSAELGMRNEEAAAVFVAVDELCREGAAVVENVVARTEFSVLSTEGSELVEKVVQDRVLSTEYSVLSTDRAVPPGVEGESVMVQPPEVQPIEASENPITNEEPTSLSAQSAIHNPQSAIAPEPGPTQSQAVARRQPQPPACSLTGKRIAPPIDEHRPWRRVFLPREWLLANPTASGVTPEGVLWKLAPPTAQIQMDEPEEDSGSYESASVWGEPGSAEQDALESSELLVGV